MYQSLRMHAPPKALVSGFMNQLTGETQGTRPARLSGDSCMPLIEMAAQRSGMESPYFNGVVASGGELVLKQFPCYHVIWQGQSQTNDFSTRLYAKGRLEIFFMQEFDEGDELAALDYVLNIKESVTNQLRKQRGRLSAAVVEEQLAIPTKKFATDPHQGLIQWIELRSEYGLTIRV